MATIIVASPAANKAKKIEDFNGRTWGELKSHAVVRELMVGSVEAIVNPGNVTLSREDAVLPQGDFKLFLVPTKNKAGITDNEARQIGETIAKAIVDASKKADANDINELKGGLVKTVEDFYGVQLDVTNGQSTNIPELDAALNEAHSM